MSNKKINLIAADMGYGHQRAAYPLLSLSGGEIITINDYPGIPDWEKKYWINSLKSYEKISRLKKIPVLGQAVFAVMDYFQKIEPLYPYRDLSKQTTQQKYFLKFIKKGLGRDLIEKLNKTNLPFVTTFFVAAYMADYYKYNGDIYCIICDTDASRAWGPLYPEESRIKYLVPSENVRTRFLMYGVKPENIIISGFPLPKENIGEAQEILKTDLARRIASLDLKNNYRQAERALLESRIPDALSSQNKSSVCITYAVGGAGAQKEIGAALLSKLSKDIKSANIKINLVAGNRLEVKEYFETEIKKNGLGENKGVNIVYDSNKIAYFKKFNECLHTTDILWTKPSELSFYSALGLPIIISSPVGSQEDFNREWLLAVGSGIDSLNVDSVNEWLPPLLDSGRLARAAMNGFLNANAMGIYSIEKLFKN